MNEFTPLDAIRVGAGSAAMRLKADLRRRSMKDDDKEREAHRRRIREAFDSLVADGLLVDSGRKRRSPITGEWQTVYVASEVAERRAKRDQRQ